jgi:hypothetical protein
MRLFRFPFGACKPESLKLVGDLGLVAVQWDVSSIDPSRAQTADKMTSWVVRQVRPGSIVLFHANGRGWHTTEAIPKIVRALRKRGFAFRTVGRLLRVAGAVPELSPTCFDSKLGDTDRYDRLSSRLHQKYDRFERKFGNRPRLKRRPVQVR